MKGCKDCRERAAFDKMDKQQKACELEYRHEQLAKSNVLKNTEAFVRKYVAPYAGPATKAHIELEEAGIVYVVVDGKKHTYTVCLDVCSNTGDFLLYTEQGSGCYPSEWVRTEKPVYRVCLEAQDCTGKKWVKFLKNLPPETKVTFELSDPGMNPAEMLLEAY